MTDFNEVVDIETTETATDTDFDLFDETDSDSDDFDFADEDIVEDEKIEVEETIQPEAEEPKYLLKHLNEEKEVTIEEMRTLAQKGMDYDYVRQGHDEYKQMFKDLIGDTGMTPRQFVDEYRRGITEAKIRERASEIMDSELVSEEFALRLAKAEIGNEIAIKEEESARNAILEQEQAQEQEKQKVMDDINLLIKLRPELSDPNFKLPSEVIQMVEENNLPLSTAYLGWVSKQNEVEIQQLKQAQKNKEMSVGSMKSNGGKEPDDFLKALFSD